MKSKSLLLLSVASLMMLASCNSVTENSSSSISESSEIQSSISSESSEEIKTISIAEAISIANASGETESERYYVAGRIKEITDYTYGDMTLTDLAGENEITVFRFRGADGETIYSNLEDKPKVGDDVILYSTLCMYKGSPEIKSGYLIKVTHNQSNKDLSGYTQMSIAEGREKAKGTKMKITGVVARITYAFGMVKDGFYVIDNTSSIYVYSREAASEVAEGNTITIAGELDFWILDDEKTNATKYGYGGACQLIDTTIISNDNGTSTFNKSWITTKAIKEIMNTSYSDNVTNKIFKTDALIKKVEGTGFTNYYIDDIDGKTGTYTYTKCNGSDFTWLDEFDGKICTVYVTAMNAKSSASGCNWRLIPVSVSYDNYKFDTSKVGEYVWEYEIKDLFKEEYTGDPLLEVPTSVSSSLLGFSGATVTYSSSNTEVAYFETSGDKTIFHAVAEGNATITVSISYSTNAVYTQTFNVKYNVPEEINAITVKEAIESEAQDYNSVTEDTKYVTVKGIAGPSVANKTGFYLIDETGAIAVWTSDAIMSEIQFGQEVIIKGIRCNYQPKNTAGQICIFDAKLVSNLYGSHEYSTASFKNDKTLTELYAASTSDASWTAQVYTLTGTISYKTSTYSTNAYLTSGDTEIQLYSGKAHTDDLKGQYDDFYQFAGKEVTVEFALCNWNGRTPYKGAVLSATDGEMKAYNKSSY